MTSHPISGLHHITAIASDPQANLDFYTELLGLRLVKLTVNFDDPGAYHFYFGDASGTPGTILTFFPWPGATRGTVGIGQVSATSFAIDASSLDYWQQRLTDARVPVELLEPRFGNAVLRLADPDGLPLELVGTGDLASAPWRASTIPAAHAIRGFHSATLLAHGGDATAALLQEVMGWTFVGREGHRRRYRAPEPGGATIVDVHGDAGGTFGRLGAGTVHHIAWRTSTAASQVAWRELLQRQGFRVSPIMDRSYFQSIYFREPGGILFEIATDQPGFAVDEPPDRLGERLMLPPQFESQRQTLERALPRLTLPHQKAAARS